jgi:hypothetical protein
LFILFCIPQSQEVTYAELTLPRNKGYSQMRPAQVGVTAGGEAVVYARIDHSRRNHQNQATHGPLLTRCRFFDPPIRAEKCGQILTLNFGQNFTFQFRTNFHLSISDKVSSRNSRQMCI